MKDGTPAYEVVCTNKVEGKRTRGKMLVVPARRGGAFVLSGHPAVEQHEKDRIQLDEVPLVYQPYRLDISADVQEVKRYSSFLV